MSRMAEAGSSSSGLTAALMVPICCQQFAHVLGAGARGRLVGHGRHPLDQTVLEQAAQAHQHAGTVQLPPM